MQIGEDLGKIACLIPQYCCKVGSGTGGEEKKKATIEPLKYVTMLSTVPT
jgi:hypothetical protein